jgi:hypothetical protein
MKLSSDGFTAEEGKGHMHERLNLWWTEVSFGQLWEMGKPMARLRRLLVCNREDKIGSGKGSSVRSCRVLGTMLRILLISQSFAAFQNSVDARVVRVCCCWIVGPRLFINGACVTALLSVTHVCPSCCL